MVAPTIGITPRQPKQRGNLSRAPPPKVAMPVTRPQATIRLGPRRPRPALRTMRGPRLDAPITPPPRKPAPAPRKGRAPGISAAIITAKTVRGAPRVPRTARPLNSGVQVNPTKGPRDAKGTAKLTPTTARSRPQGSSPFAARVAGGARQKVVHTPATVAGQGAISDAYVGAPMGPSIGALIVGILAEHKAREGGRVAPP